MFSGTYPEFQEKFNEIIKEIKNGTNGIDYKVTTTF